MAERLRALPEVGRVTTLDTFVPAQQQQKMMLIASAAQQLLPALQQQPAPQATDAVRVAALKRASNQLSLAADDHPGPGAAEAKHLSDTLQKLAAADAATRDRAENAMSEPLRIALKQLENLLQPTEITRENLPKEISKGWVSKDGRALVDIAPKVKPGADPNDDVALARFAHAVKKAEPGCLVYRPHRSTKDPDIFIFYEQYKDDAAFDAHRKAPHLTAYRERREKEGLTEGAPEVVARPVSAALGTAVALAAAGVLILGVLPNLLVQYAPVSTLVAGP